MIEDYLKNNVLLTDGAMGTYYSKLSGKDAMYTEIANITQPELIKKIHMEYINAGAKFIKTNTFSANTLSLDLPWEKVEQIIKKACQIAYECTEGKNIFIGADIGPIPDLLDQESQADKDITMEQYQLIIDTFLEQGMDIFIFETFSSTDYIKELSRYIKDKKPTSFIISQFALMADGFTTKGISASRLIQEIRSTDTIDAYGFNCGTGPSHVFNILKTFDFKEDIVSIMPNSGYPEVKNQKTVYIQNAEYFADIMMDIESLGVKILGGCCGTTPLHIRSMYKKINYPSYKKSKKQVSGKKKVPIKYYKKQIGGKLKHKDFPIAVELDPPSNTGVDKIIQGAYILKQNGVDVITISDSPLARTRMNSVMLAAMIQREVGIETVPHICCRDRNIIAIKSDILAAHAQGIRNILAVTGDPVPGGKKSEIKGVFNLNSISLMKMISEMNKEHFKHDPYIIGGALNLAAANMEMQISRTHKKIQAGSTFFLTQPIFKPEVTKNIKNINRSKDIKILGGIMPLVSYRNAMFLNNEVHGIQIPEKYINMFSPDMDRSQAQDIGIEIACNIAQEIKSYMDGFYIVTPFNRVEMIVQILKRVI
ncbi:MAG: bifunctional homocysteine S-methyltransferase/methylenetetrahydrofolate reductase [Clostridia bacterium]|nr:bifunctional homocysteine S-methyltransferase/methylenetetrahydrofolate reductase [Clostridia bacterium]